MRFRPCIDLHDGVVKQIIGSSLKDTENAPETNFIASQPPSYFAEMYKRDGLTGGHVIMLGPGNEAAAKNALAAFPGGLQLGGGINPANAESWLAAGAAKLIVTSYIFTDGKLNRERLRKLTDCISAEKLVVDLSCRRCGDAYFVATDRWQTITDVKVCRETITELAGFCGELLVHAVDVEGKQQGVELKLVTLLAEIAELPVTYAGGIRSISDLELLENVGKSRIDFTVGSALDIFGGRLSYAEVLAFVNIQ